MLIRHPSLEEFKLSDAKWTDKEKKIARRAFDLALERERDALLAEFKQKALAANDFDDLWNIQSYLRDKQRELDTKFDYRYSQLEMVFAVLLRDKRISEAELDGLAEERLAAIRLLCSFFSTAKTTRR